MVYFPSFLFSLLTNKQKKLDTSSIIFIDASNLLKTNEKKFNLLIENVQEFYIKKDFMFATQKILNSTIVLISYKRGRFVKADFQTELDIKVGAANIWLVFLVS